MSRDSSSVELTPSFSSNICGPRSLIHPAVGCLLICLSAKSVCLSSHLRSIRELEDVWGIRIPLAGVTYTQMLLN